MSGLGEDALLTTRRCLLAALSAKAAGRACLSEVNVW